MRAHASHMYDHSSAVFGMGMVGASCMLDACFGIGMGQASCSAKAYCMLWPVPTCDGLQRSFKLSAQIPMFGYIQSWWIIIINCVEPSAQRQLCKAHALRVAQSSCLNPSCPYLPYYDLLLCSPGMSRRRAFPWRQLDVLIPGSSSLCCTVLLIFPLSLFHRNCLEVEQKKPSPLDY